MGRRRETVGCCAGEAEFCQDLSFTLLYNYLYNIKYSHTYIIHQASVQLYEIIYHALASSLYYLPFLL